MVLLNLFTNWITIRYRRDLTRLVQSRAVKILADGQAVPGPEITE